MREVGVDKSAGLPVLETSVMAGAKVLWMKTDVALVPGVLSGWVAADNSGGE